MKLLKAIGSGLAFTVLALLVVPSAKAEEWNRKTIVNISGPVEVPGVVQHTLPAGTYVFKIMDSTANRHIVQIFSQDESTLLTTILSIPNFRAKVKDDTVITFHEVAAGEIQPIKAWYYPGRQYGEYFVWEHARAVQLAVIENEPVLSTPVEAAKVEDLTAAPVEAVTPTGAVVETATVVVPPPAEPVVVAVAAPAPVLVASLPKTASNLSLFGLFGFLALGAGLMLTGLIKRIA